ncbi:phosphotransferase [Nocardia sp. NPDC057030]|uniref:phosphotransferase n=1 Tax=unclassified Nocardia TaxID=2637762 RepID=UPI00362640B0
MIGKIAGLFRKLVAARVRRAERAACAVSNEIRSTSGTLKDVVQSEPATDLVVGQGLGAGGARFEVSERVRPGSMDPVLAERICQEFRLGTLSKDPEQVSGSHANEAWRMDTDRNTYIVKHFIPSPTDTIPPVPRLRSGFRLLEKPIADRGPSRLWRVPTPVPVPGESECLKQIDGKYFRVHEWLDGSRLERLPHTMERSETVGRVVAGIHRMAPVGEVIPNKLPFTEARWLELADRIHSRAPEAATRLRSEAALLSRVHRLTYQPIPPGAALFSHGDLGPWNMMECADGSIAVYDWDRPDNVNSVYELISAVGSSTTTEQNFVDPDLLLAGIKGYVEASGTRLPAEPAIFGRWVNGQAEWVEHHTEPHRFDDEPDKFNAEVCLQKVERAVNLFGSIERGQQAWLAELASIIEAAPG